MHIDCYNTLQTWPTLMSYAIFHYQQQIIEVWQHKKKRQNLNILTNCNDYNYKQPMPFNNTKGISRTAIFRKLYNLEPITGWIKPQNHDTFFNRSFDWFMLMCQTNQRPWLSETVNHRILNARFFVTLTWHSGIKSIEKRQKSQQGQPLFRIYASVVVLVPYKHEGGA